MNFVVIYTYHKYDWNKKQEIWLVLVCTVLNISCTTTWHKNYVIITNLYLIKKTSCLV